MSNGIENIMALAYATAALETLADKFSLYLHVEGLNFAFLLPSVIKYVSLCKNQILLL